MNYGTWTEKKSGSRFAVVFIHGIFSDQSTFEKMIDEFKKKMKKDVDLGYFTFDFNRAISENARDLIIGLKENFRENDRITLVCHSMGGLIARLAILETRGLNIPIKKLIMLGTPNHGALRSVQLSLLSQLSMSAGGYLCGVFLRKAGLRDLTQVNHLFEKHKGEYAAQADNIDYITIPATFFNNSRRMWEIGEWGESKLFKAFFASFNLGSEILSALQPLWKVTLERPHDGIVEASSNCLIPAGSARWSEKAGPINFHNKYEKKSYAHIFHIACDRLTHVKLHKDKEIIEIVYGLAFSDSLNSWYDGLSKEDAHKFDVKCHV
ncbi:MAG: alpha/beta hydrolase [bacterium]|nr:alpha/beta hydrolase [bacterium]